MICHHMPHPSRSVLVHTACHSCNSSSSVGLELVVCTAGSGSAEDGAAVEESERWSFSVLAVLLEAPAEG